VSIHNVSLYLKLITAFVLVKTAALPHEKCYRKKVMPHIENVTQMIVSTPEGGRPNVVNYERETGGNEGI
jgi:hypothetical protein